jgi:hypothetical protein
MRPAHVVLAFVRVEGFDRRVEEKITSSVMKVVRRDRSSVYRAMSFMRSGRSRRARTKRFARVEGGFVRDEAKRMRDKARSVRVAIDFVRDGISFAHVATFVGHVVRSSMPAAMLVVRAVIFAVGPEASTARGMVSLVRAAMSPLRAITRLRHAAESFSARARHPMRARKTLVRARSRGCAVATDCGHVAAALARAAPRLVRSNGRRSRGETRYAQSGLPHASCEARRSPKARPGRLVGEADEGRAAWPFILVPACAKCTRTPPRTRSRAVLDRPVLVLFLVPRARRRRRRRKTRRESANRPLSKGRCT